MGSWTLDAFIDGDAGMTLEEVAQGCVKASGDDAAVLSDDHHPFNGRRLGIRATWGDWWIVAMMLDETGAAEEAKWLSASKTPPAEARKRVAGCTRCVRVIFGRDTSPGLDFTNHIVGIMAWLEEISGRRVYDPRQKSFTHHASALR